MIKYYIEAARLRTLPLSVSGIILGSFLAASSGFFNWNIFVLAIFTTIGFQVLSNFANDYGDGVKGTDNEHRVGPKRAIQSGKLTPKQMLKAIWLTIGITLIIAVLLIYQSFGKDDFINLLIFFFLGVASVVAAIKYTVGNSAYGYHGLGDLFVFLFFGLLSVCGSYYLYTKKLPFDIFLPAISVGVLSVGVLNLNNMRDLESDLRANKNTLAVILGKNRVKIYHYSLLIMALLSSLTYLFLNFKSYFQFIYLLSFIPIFKHFSFVYNIDDLTKLDSQLKKLALSTFLFAVLFGIALILPLVL
ncbi:MAG: 1,4-dihydroxy-2-naphthoate octaprenyltransferase [Lutibacter sp.]